jgi:hypothetical protein
MIVDARLRKLQVNSNTLHMKHFLCMSGKSIVFRDIKTGAQFDI